MGCFLFTSNRAVARATSHQGVNQPTLQCLAEDQRKRGCTRAGTKDIREWHIQIPHLTCRWHRHTAIRDQGNTAESKTDQRERGCARARARDIRDKVP